MTVDHVMYVAVEGEGLTTQFAEAPQVTLSAQGGTTDAVMTFDSSLVESDGSSWATTIRFVCILDFHFFDFELGINAHLTNQEDIAFRLIEITDSELLNQFAVTGSLQRTAKPVLTMIDIHHYRIAFDDHGTYDIICTGIDLARSKFRS